MAGEIMMYTRRFAHPFFFAELHPFWYSVHSDRVVGRLRRGKFSNPTDNREKLKRYFKQLFLSRFRKQRFIVAFRFLSNNTVLSHLPL